MTRRRQGSLPKSESPDNDNDGDVDVDGIKNNNVVKRDFRLDDLVSMLSNTFSSIRLQQNKLERFFP
jgi:hypothetical protein